MNTLLLGGLVGVCLAIVGVFVYGGWRFMAHEREEDE